MRLAYFLALLTAAALSTSALSEERGTPDEAKAMALKAAEHARQVGTTQALTDFNTSPQWRDRDLYVVAFTTEGIMTANPAMPALLGKKVIDLKDVEGKPFMREQLAIKDEGWVEFKWKNPITNALEPKTVYVVRMDDSWRLNVGAYKK